MGEPIQSSGSDYPAMAASLETIMGGCGKCSHDPSDLPPPAKLPREMRSTEPATGGADMVNHPAHYAALSPEPIDVIEGWEQDYLEGNITKYLARWKRKGGLEDLRKMQWYANRLVKREESRA